MPDLTLSGYQSIAFAGQGGSDIEFEAVLQPLLHNASRVPVLEDLTTEGVNGYRSRLVHVQQKRIAVIALYGAQGIAAASTAASSLEALDGSYGTAVFRQAGVTLTFKKAQLRDVRTEVRNARFTGLENTGAAFDWPACYRAEFDLILNEEDRAA